MHYRLALIGLDENQRYAFKVRAKNARGLPLAAQELGAVYTAFRTRFRCILMVFLLVWRVGKVLRSSVDIDLQTSPAEHRESPRRPRYPGSKIQGRSLAEVKAASCPTSRGRGGLRAARARHHPAAAHTLWHSGPGRSHLPRRKRRVPENRLSYNQHARIGILPQSVRHKDTHIDTHI